MASLINLHVHSPAVMKAAGFNYTHRGDTARCAICELEVSHWTCDMNPFTVHAERSPRCAFVRSLGNNFQACSSSTNDFTSQRPTKRQKIGPEFNLCEADTLKQARCCTFAHRPHPTSYCSRMVEAGFFSCTLNDRVICIYCNLICQQWNMEIDDPCEVHRLISPGCQYVRSMLHKNSSQCNKILPTMPNYIDPQKRLESFSAWHNKKFPSPDQLVDAGFYYDNSKITCFYCNGSFTSWESNNHPLAEHVRRFPYCNYAKQLCGEELHEKIQRSIKNGSKTDELRNVHHDRCDTHSEDTLRKLVADRLDLPISKKLLEKGTFKRWIIERCWKDQIQLKGDDFANDRDLYMACDILRRQIENQQNIIIPSIRLKDIYQKRQIPLFNESYTDISKSFGDDLQRHINNQKTLGIQYIEEKAITIAREQSLKNWSCNKPSQSDVIKGGWIVSDTEDYLYCPCCHIQYYNWKSDDNPLLTHQYLSPLCLFVLSMNPLNANSIPVIKAREQFTDENIAQAESQPYNGLVKSNYESNFKLTARRTSFDSFPGGCPSNADELAECGFYYPNRGRSIRCFYCKRGMIIWNRNSQSLQCITNLHRVSQCPYIKQLNDHDPVQTSKQTTNECPCCMKEEKRLVALPCRHFSVCESCGRFKRLCTKCNEEVSTYLVVYPS